MASYMLHNRRWDSRKMHLFMLQSETPKIMYIIKQSNKIHILKLIVCNCIIFHVIRVFNIKKKRYKFKVSYNCKS